MYGHIKSSMKKNIYVAFIAEENKEVVGIIQGIIEKGYFVYDVERVGHIQTVYVKKKYRRKGVLKALMKEILKWFKSKNITWIDHYTHKKNIEAISASADIGFKEILKYMRKEI